MRSSTVGAFIVLVSVIASACNCGPESSSDGGTGGGSAGGGNAGGGNAGGGNAGGGNSGGGNSGGGNAGGGGVDAGTLDAGPGDAGPRVDAGDPLRCTASDGGPVFFGPLRYRAASDTPFPCPGAATFLLDTLEDDSLDIPGTSTNGTFTYPFFGAITDSVDFDDGRLDNDCNRSDAGRFCQSLFGSGPTGLSILFSSADGGFGGQLPTFAGLVWTDGEGQVRFEAYGADGGLLGVLGPFNPADAGFPGSGVSRETDEDRFFGVAFPGGISRITAFNSAGGIEIDHPQAGR